MAKELFGQMKDDGIKTLGVICFDDAYGQSWVDLSHKTMPTLGIDIVDVERYSRHDTDVTGQALKLLAAHPDAVLCGVSDSPGVLPMQALVAHGYKGKVYFSSGVAAQNFLRVGGKALNGGIAAVGPNLVWEQLPDDYPTKKVSADFVPRFEAKFGAQNRSNFAAQAYDVWLILEHAVPVAMQKAKPGTQEFRIALRDAIEGLKEMPGNSGVYSYTPENHGGLDLRAGVLCRIENGKWVLIRTFYK
jgi:branched-chain amino acid transport system substrate-binding protein